MNEAAAAILNASRQAYWDGYFSALDAAEIESRKFLAEELPRLRAEAAEKRDEDLRLAGILMEACGG